MAPAPIAVNAASIKGLRGARQTYQAMTSSVARATTMMMGMRMLAGIQRVRLNAVSRFSITLDEAAGVLATEPNETYLPGHRYLDERELPRIRDFKEFYVDPPRARAALLGRTLARQQGVVWGTGTHTSTLVLAIASGPPAWTRRFSGLHHETEIGRILMDALSLD